ncbi:MAG: hypothetical protein WBK48_07250 [Dethiobacteria bacterium]
MHIDARKFFLPVLLSRAACFYLVASFFVLGGERNNNPQNAQNTAFLKIFKEVVMEEKMPV